MGYFQSNLAGTGGSGTFPGSNSTIYKVDDPSSESGNGGLNNLGQPVMPGFTSGLGGAEKLYIPLKTAKNRRTAWRVLTQ